MSDLFLLSEAQMHLVEPSFPLSHGAMVQEDDDMSEVHILAVDLAKRSFQVGAVDLGDAPGFAR